MEIIKLNLIPNGVNPTCHAKQYDEGRVIRFELFDGLTPYTLQSGDTVTLNLRKPDNTIIETSVTATQGNKYVDLVTTEQMCACVGYNLGTFKIANGSVDIGTLNFIMQVERDVLADGIPSQSVIEDLDALVQEAVGDQYYTKTEVDAALSSKASASEVENIRVGFDGTTYASAGDAVRNQVSKVNNDIDMISYFEEGNIVFSDETETVGGTGVYINKKICDIDNVNVGDTYTLFIEDIDITGTATSASYAYIFSYDSNGVRITTSGYTGATGTTTENAHCSITIGEGTASIGVILYPITTSSTASVDYKGISLVKGTSIIPDNRYIKNSSIKTDKKVLYVGSDCTYKTIQSAVDAANDGDTIIIMEGTYDEAVSVYGDTGNIHGSSKYLHFIGINRDKCILTHDVGDYSNPPLEIARGTVENLTIVCTGNTYAEGSNQFAYCVHIDYNSCANSGLQFKNCNFKNTVYPCVGVGLRDGFYLAFESCNFDCESSSAFLFHEEQASNKTNQHISFSDCSFVGHSSTETIHVQESGVLTGNYVEVTFMRCIVKNTSTGVLAKRFVYPTGDSSEGNGWLNTRIYFLSDISDLNSDPLFDK